jgi:hypothetical protein
MFLGPTRGHTVRPRDFSRSNQSRSGQCPDAFVISDEGGRALDTVPLAEVLPEALKK